jgi:hypothetical protein
MSSAAFRELSWSVLQHFSTTGHAPIPDQSLPSDTACSPSLCLTTRTSSTAVEKPSGSLPQPVGACPFDAFVETATACTDAARSLGSIKWESGHGSQILIHETIDFSTG